MQDPEVKHPWAGCLLLCNVLEVWLSLCISVFLIWQWNYQRVNLFGLGYVEYLSCSVQVEALVGVSEDASSEWVGKTCSIHWDKLVFHLQTQENPFPCYLYGQFYPYKRLKPCLFKRSKVSDTSNQWYKTWSMAFKTCSSLNFSQWYPCCLFRKHLLMNTFFFSPAVDISVSCQKFIFRKHTCVIFWALYPDEN